MAAPTRMAGQVTTAAPKADDKKAKQRDIGQIPQWKLMVGRFMRARLSVAGLIVLLLMYVLAILASFLAPNHYDKLDSNFAYVKPTKIVWANGRPSICSLNQTLDQTTFTWVYKADCTKPKPIKFFVQGYAYGLFGMTFHTHLFGVDDPDRIFLLGTDSLGRDVFARILHGARVSLTIGLVGVAISVILGAVLGTASGYFGGAIDNIMQRLIELIQSMPTLPLWMAMGAAVPKDMPVIWRYFLITVVLSLVSWTGLARQVRAKVMAYRNSDYTSAARLAGASHGRIILTHMVPNALSHIIVVATLAVPGMILGETTLSFLGLGMTPPAVSWGVLLKDAQQIQTVTTYPWLMVPGLTVVIAVLCFQLLGDGMRDAVDPYS